MALHKLCVLPFGDFRYKNTPSTTGGKENALECAE